MAYDYEGNYVDERGMGPNPEFAVMPEPQAMSLPAPPPTPIMSYEEWLKSQPQPPPVNPDFAVMPPTGGYDPMEPPLIQPTMPKLDPNYDPYAPYDTQRRPYDPYDPYDTRPYTPNDVYKQLPYDPTYDSSQPYDRYSATTPRVTPGDDMRVINLNPNYNPYSIDNPDFQLPPSYGELLTRYAANPAGFNQPVSSYDDLLGRYIADNRKYDTQPNGSDYRPITVPPTAPMASGMAGAAAGIGSDLESLLRRYYGK
jgi:hypothetical protein